MRGLYRWSEERDGIEVWFARIDRSRGEWETIAEEQYLLEGLLPVFGDLPLKDEYLIETIDNAFSGSG
jgi:hypothetical protein